MTDCPNCGATDTEGKKFCRHCGTHIEPPAEEATTWRLPATTSKVSKSQTAETPSQTSPAYLSPVSYEPKPQPPVAYVPEQAPGRPDISLGDWLSEGWRIYKDNWVVMSFGTMFAAFFSLITAGVLAGPLLMGLYRMVFKAMRGERPELGDLFKWEGRFLQAFVTFLIFAAMHLGFTRAGDGGLFFLLSFLVDPLITISLSLVLPLILERKIDVIKAINEVGRLIFSKDAFKWWLVGLVLVALSFVGTFACFVGVFVTVPWVIASASVAYRDIFGLDDPNRTLA